MTVCAGCDSQVAPGQSLCSRCRPSLRGTLEYADQRSTRQPIQAEVSEGRLLLYASVGKVGEWSLAEIRLARAVEGFSLIQDGVEMRLIVEDFSRFFDLVSDADQDLEGYLQAPPEPPRSQWWRFWSDDSWRTWRARRVPWTEHRRRVRSLQSRIDQLNRSMEETPDARSREHDAALLRAAEKQIAEAVAPPRPISPAWVLATTAVIVALVLGAGAADLGEEAPTTSPNSVAITHPAGESSRS